MKCLQREIKYRERVYARRVTAGQMTQKLADYELGCMRAAMESLEPRSAKERLL